MGEILRKIGKSFRRTRYSMGRLVRHLSAAIRIVTSILSVATVAASIMCIVAMLIYIGFDNSVSQSMLINRLLRASQIVFVVNVSFNLVFNFRRTLKDSKIIKWISDSLILLSLLPLAYPRPIHPWIPVLEEILYSNKFLFPVLALYALLTISFGIVRLLGKRTNPSLILSCSFLFLIVAGSFLLMMPRCTYYGISYVDSLFVSTSAVCITGLTGVDLSTTFTPFGILIIGLLAQIGGLGVMTFTSFFALFFSGSTSIYSQLMVKDMIYTKSINSLLPTLLYILGFTLIIELIGGLAIFFCIHDQLGLTAGDEIAFAAFHSMSAFCNAGFSNYEGGFSNPILLYGNQAIYLVITILVIAGGIGFPVLVNFKDALNRYLRRFWKFISGKGKRREKFHVYDVNTKVAVVTTMTIALVSSALFFVFEYNNTLAGMTLSEKCVQSVFNSFVPRSSGFSSVNPCSFLNITVLMMMFLMWIGGASQSMAGGIKVNAFATMLISLKTIVTGGKYSTVYGRMISHGSIQRAYAVIAISVMVYVVYSMILVAMEPALPVKGLLFESASALFTVGSSLGITPLLSSSSKVLLCTAMFLGRVGILSLLIGFFARTSMHQVKFPEENIIIN